MGVGGASGGAGEAPSGAEGATVALPSNMAPPTGGRAPSARVAFASYPEVSASPPEIR